MSRRYLAWMLTLSMVIVVLFGGESLAVSYTFTKIVDTMTPAPIGTFQLSDNFSTPTINNGVVAFQSNFGTPSSPNNYGIFMGSGGPITTIAKMGDAAPVGTFTSFPDFASTSSGNATFVGAFGSGQKGIFLGNGGPLTTIVKMGDASPGGTAFTDVRRSSMSGSQVTFQGVSNNGNDVGVYVANGGGFTTIAKTGDLNPIGGTFTAVAPADIDGDNVAFLTSSANFVGSGGPVTTIVKEGDPAPVNTFLNIDGFPSLSGNTVAFEGSFLAGGSISEGIFIGNGGPLTTILQSGDPAPVGAFNHLDSPSIVNGLVAFSASYRIENGPGGRGIFVSDGGLLQGVTNTGDSLFGSTVTFLSLGPRRGLDTDGSGRIAFYYELANNRRGFAVATPTPEPASFALALIALLGTALKRWLRRR